MSSNTHRDPWLDIIRAAALALVAIGHWLLPVATRTSTGTEVHSMLEAGGWVVALTWGFQVVPLIFAIGAKANEGSWTRHEASGGNWASWVGERTTRLVGPVGILIAFALFLGPIVTLAGLDPELGRQAVRFMTLPVWFLAAYLLQIAITPPLTRVRQAHPTATIGVLAGLVVALDVLRVTDTFAVAAVMNWVFVFALVSVLGIEIMDRERRQLLPIAAGSLVVLGVLVAVGFYAPALVGGPGTARSNNSPPTGALVLIGAAHTALGLGLRPRTSRRAKQPKPTKASGPTSTPTPSGGLIGWIAARQMTVFLWHLPVGFALVGASIALGLMPHGGWWWASRPLWLIICAIATLVVVGPIAKLEQHLDRNLGRAAGWWTPVAWIAATATCSTLAANGVGWVPALGWLVFASAATAPKIFTRTARSATREQHGAEHSHRRELARAH